MEKVALISVSDKRGIIEFARFLNEKNYKILSTGGTASLLEINGIKIIKVSEFTGAPEIFGGRVKTLHPKVFGGILGRRNDKSDQLEAKKSDISWIDLVVVNCYPFAETIAKAETTFDQAVEQIDVGGPSMIRAAAKNFKDVAVVTDPADYEQIQEMIEKNELSVEFRKRLACKAFRKTSEYDELIAAYICEDCGEPELLDLHYVKVRSLRYGENPHQKAAFFRNPENHDANVTNADVLHGKQLSFNNIVDADSALELVKEFDRPAAVFVKHNNPCGVATGKEIQTTFALAHQVDPLSAFGCVIAVNRPINNQIVDYIDQNKLFVEIIAAPDFEPEALERLKKRENLRLLKTGELKLDRERRDIKKVAGGILVQSADTYIVTEADLKFVTKKKPTADEITAMLFAQKIVKHVKSNAVVFAKIEADESAVVTAIGAGQMSRVDSVTIATIKGAERIKGSVMASDAFFPFSDAVEQAAKAGATAILQPGGSIRDDEVIARADELGLAMVLTGIRNFRH